MRKYDVIFDVNEPLIEANNRKYATVYIDVADMPIYWAEKDLQNALDWHELAYGGDICRVCKDDRKCHYHTEVVPK